jgi:flagellar protein FliO/FliZ
VAVLTAALTLAHACVAGAYTPPSVARAENTPLHLGTSTTTHASGAGASGASITRTLVGLVIVVALIYGITWVLRRLKRQGGDRALGTGLESVASLPLGPGRSLALVRAGTEFMLVGVAEQQVTPIRRYSEDEARAAGLLADDSELPARIDTLTHEGARRLSNSIGADPPPMERSLQGILETVRNWTVRS